MVLTNQTTEWLGTSTATTSSTSAVAWRQWNNSFYEDGYLVTRGKDTGDLIWTYWVRSTCTNSGSSSTANVKIAEWERQAYYRTTATTNTWSIWNQCYDQILVQRHQQHIQRTRTPEQIEADRILAERHQLEADAAARARQAVKERAEKLLQSVLTPQQNQELKDKGHFHCRSKTGRTYRIKRGTHGNVKVVNEAGKEIESLCIQPGGVPEADSMAAQKLMIEADEESFRKIANITRLPN
jgi:hypothetical protein